MINIFNKGCLRESSLYIYAFDFYVSSPHGYQDENDKWENEDVYLCSGWFKSRQDAEFFSQKLMVNSNLINCWFQPSRCLRLGKTCGSNTEVW